MSLFIFNSSIGRKLVMSITGLALVLFLIFHSIMNLFVIISPEVYNQICHFLGANWYALVATVGLSLLVVIHILYAFWLSVQNYIARGNQRYAVTKKSPGVDWASQNMLVLGLIILGFLILHLFNFWYKMQWQEILAKTSGEELHVAGAGLVQALFSNPVYSLIYIVWLCALWFHLTHGVWSAIQTMGGSNMIWLPRIKMISNIVATIVILMFMSIPVYFLITNLLA
jgi:succinate dehydrogenase / fumarate reductase, cytochrome b subunit